MANYWIVGATVSGQDMTAWFIKHGIWFGNKDTAQSDIAKIQKGDRIAIKKMRGQGSTAVDINAIGVVEDVGDFNALEFHMIFVNWISLLGEGKQAPFKGLAGTIHGPYTSNDEIVDLVFNLK